MENTLKNSENYIREKALKTGFLAPKGYFDSIEDTFSARLKEQELPNDHGFMVDDTYFDTLEQHIVSKVPVRETKVISLRRGIIRMVPVAAAAVIALFIIFISPVTQDELTSEEIANWFDENIYRISYEDITFAFEDMDIEDEGLTDAIDIDDIENYLENIDTTPLLDEIN